MHALYFFLASGHSLLRWGEDEPCGLGFPDGYGVILVMGVRPFLLLVVQGTAGKAHEKA